MRKLMSTVALTALLLSPTYGADPSWDAQVREMGYLIMQLSAINAINGLNLTRDQAVRLRSMVEQVEAAGAKPATSAEPGDVRLESVRKTYYELRDVLTKGRPVPKELERRVAVARITEAKVIRESMQTTPLASERLGACTRCHAKPRSQSAAGRDKAAPTQAIDRLHRMRHDQARQAFVAHVLGLYGLQGTRKLKTSLPKVDALLTPAQKAIIQEFACCLLPPQGLNDPVRAGQAQVSEDALKVLRGARQATDRAWPYVKGSMLARMATSQRVRQPGFSAKDQQALSAHLAGVLDKARAMSEVEFEMEKENLCRELKPGSDERSTRPENTRRFMAAYFLLLPGLGDMYTEIVRRHDGLADLGASRALSQCPTWKRPR